MQPGVTREPHVIGVEMTSDEVDLYDGLLRYVKLRYFSTNQTTPPGFVLVTRERQITSCLLAAAEVLLKDTPNHNTGEDIGYEGNDIELEDAPYAIQSLMLQGNMSQLRQHLLDLAEGLGSVDSKISNFLEGLREVHRDNPAAKVLVFSSFKATLRYLNRQLSREASWIEGRLCITLDGDVAVAERPRIIDRFKEAEGFSVLLMSDNRVRRS